MALEKNFLYESASDFFTHSGSVWMRLSPNAAADVCLKAASHGLVVARVEGGIWHYPGFEARHDCIWDGGDPPIETLAAHENNLQAAEFIESQRTGHSVFILTTPPIAGWPHKNNIVM